MDLVVNSLSARILDKDALYAPAFDGVKGTAGGTEGGVVVAVSLSRLEVAVDVVRETYELASHLNRLDPETSYMADDISISEGNRNNLRQRFRPEFSNAMGSQLDVALSDLRVWLGPDPTSPGATSTSATSRRSLASAHPLAGELPLLSADLITIMGRPVIAAQLAPLSFRSVNEEVPC